jgi:hypothetical protein
MVFDKRKVSKLVPKHLIEEHFSDFSQIKTLIHIKTGERFFFQPHTTVLRHTHTAAYEKSTTRRRQRKKQKQITFASRELLIMCKNL